jgi:hypothetical protein
MHKHTKRALSLAGLWAVSALAACGEAPQATAPNTDDLGGRAGLALTVDLLGETDIARISYTVTGWTAPRACRSTRSSSRRWCATWRTS